MIPSLTLATSSVHNNIIADSRTLRNIINHLVVVLVLVLLGIELRTQSRNHSPQKTGKYSATSVLEIDIDHDQSLLKLRFN